MQLTSLLGAFVAAYICFALVVLLVPSVFNSHHFVDGLLVLIKRRKFGAALSFVLFSMWIPGNRLLMAVEDVIFPELKDVGEEYFTKRNKLVFITGHQRSGTTNVHKAVSSLKGVNTGTQLDGATPSLIMKYLTYPLVQLIDLIFFKVLIH